MFLTSYQTRSRLIKKVIFWAVVLGGICALFLAQTQAFAQTSPGDPCKELGGCIGGIQQFNNSADRADNITNFVLVIVRFLVFIGAAISVLFIVIGGYQMITSAGEAEKYKKGMNTLTYAVIGLVVSIVSVTIVVLVGNLVTNLNISNG